MGVLVPEDFDLSSLRDGADVDDDLLSVGASRAVSELVVIAPEPIGARLALT